MGEGGQWKDRIAGLLQKRQAATAMGGDEKLAKREADGKTNARTRIEVLVDGGSFTEIGQLAGGGVDSFVAGVGMIDGRPVAIGSEDFTVAGGSIGQTESAKRYRIAELALQERIPLVMLLEGAGHRPPLPDASA